MESYYIEKSAAIFDEIQLALLLNNEGSYEDCLNLLMKLYESKRVYILQVNQQPGPFGGMGGIISPAGNGPLIQPQQPVQ
jgi:hypothetical protein